MEQIERWQALLSPFLLRRRGWIIRGEGVARREALGGVGSRIPRIFRRYDAAGLEFSSNLNFQN
jgi:hypothetical protein